MDGSVTKKQRKQRQTFNCAECRRLKLKCDREVPCQHCVKRKCAELCPHGTRESARRDSEAPNTALLERLEAIERRLEADGKVMESTDIQPVSAEQKEAQATIENHAPQMPNQPMPEQAVEQTAYTQMPAEPFQPTLSFDFGLSPQASNSHVSMTSDRITTISQPTGWSPNNQAFGTLMLGRGGRSKYLGPTAASEWLKDQEEPIDDSRAISRFPSPDAFSGVPAPASDFPFDSYSRTEKLIGKLPPLEDAKRIAACYFRYFAWQQNIIPTSTFDAILQRVYSYASVSYAGTDQRIDHHELALVFIILAMGTLHDLELDSDDPAAVEYLVLAKQSLSRGRFLQHNTITAVRVLHIMAHVHLHTEEGRDGDSAWPLWGLTMRLIVAMGLHRDGFRWGLANDAVQERRRVFWECHSTDVMQANCFSRPASVMSSYVDTAFPLDMDDNGHISEEKSFHILKLELSNISAGVLHAALSVEESPYSNVLELQEKLKAFERGLPHNLRCRAGYMCLPSLYVDVNRAVEDSPEPNKRLLARTLQQYTLAINISETMLFLNRPYYARAVQDATLDLTQSEFGQSYLVVVERSNAITMMVSSIFELLPAITARHWWLWHHAFNAAVCLGTLVLRSPRNLLVQLATTQVDTTVSLFQRVVQISSSKRIKQNLDWLIKLRLRIDEKLRGVSMNGTMQIAQSSEDEDETDELLGWRTRLIERASKGKQRAKTITPVANPVEVQAPATGVEWGSTDQLLHSFWDPMLLQAMPDPFDTAIINNWWDMSEDSLSGEISTQLDK